MIGATDGATTAADRPGTTATVEGPRSRLGRTSRKRRSGVGLVALLVPLGGVGFFQFRGGEIDGIEEPGSVLGRGATHDPEQGVQDHPEAVERGAGRRPHDRC
jgi:hypothetical protein